MKRIEFIGAPSVGKSTVLKELLKMRKNKDKWLTSGEARIQVAKTVQIKKINFYRFMQVCLRFNFLKRGHSLLSSVILREHEKNVLDQMQKEYSHIAALFLQELVKEKINSIQKLQFNSFYFRLLFQEVMTLDYFQIKEIIIYDEGIFHNNSAFRSEEKSGEVIKKYLNDKSTIIPSGIIYCYMEEKMYVQRRKQRIIEGKGIFLDRTLNDSELEALCYESLKSAEDKIRVLKEHNINILEIYMQDKAKENARLVYDFINKC